MTASERVVVKELSSSLLDMKFMLKKKKQIETKAAKKKEAKLDQLITEKEAEATCSTEILKSSEPKLEICYDYAKLENLKFGRLSFGGFNKEVELLMEYYEKLQNGMLSDSDDDGMDVDDEEMAKSLGGQKLAALDKKSQSKRERRQQNERNEETTGGRRFNIKDIRKRFAADDVADAPERKFMKPAEDC